MKAHWIAKAVSKNKGKFSAKAKAAGMGTLAYAEKKEGARGKLGKEARLAETLISMKKK
jgi:hypothetical protein